ncbi:hypothetical protein PINS_up016446 [Pythium insidiosum]|nr:hypothetical protein PINS_up016446 [Pythium insidiosum]
MPPTPATNTHTHTKPNAVGNSGAQGSSADTNRYWEAYADLDAIAVRHGDTGIAVHDLEKSVGLSTSRVPALREQFGFNRLSPPERVPDYILFLRQFLDLFMVLLNVAGVLSLIAYFLDTSVTLNLYLALVLFGIVLCTCVMTFLQQRSTSKVMDSFKNMLPPKCTVVRDGVSQLIAAEELVVGDLVWVRNGDKVPADLRILLCSNLKVENSSLTGESELVPLSSKPQDTAVAPLECRNVAFNGSLCFDGSALGVVLSIGDCTVIGRIAKLASATTQRETNMQREVKAFVRFVAVLAISMASVLFAIGVARKKGKDVLNTFINGFLVIIVANVPQGLPATVTSLLTITAQRMAKHNIFVKRLDCVETLGSITLVATDKTGTLTKNVMTVTDTWVGREFQRQATADQCVLDTDDDVELFGSSGRRVTAIATRRCSPDAADGTSATFSAEANSFPVDALCFVGLVAIMDPPRDDMPDAIRHCKEAGVKVFMVTGDHPLTAQAIAREIGLLDEASTVLQLLTPPAADGPGASAKIAVDSSAWSRYDAAVVHGAVIDHLTPEQFSALLRKRQIVFARTTPQHKLEIVRASQALGECVGVTGDGVNDAPALKQADVGVGQERQRRRARGRRHRAHGRQLLLHRARHRTGPRHLRQPQEDHRLHAHAPAARSRFGRHQPHARTARGALVAPDPQRRPRHRARTRHLARVRRCRERHHAPPAARHAAPSSPHFQLRCTTSVTTIYPIRYM